MVCWGQSMLSPSIPICLMFAVIAISGCAPSSSSSPLPIKAGVVTQISYSPTLIPITITLDSDCQISVKYGSKIVTPIGVFEHSIAAKMKPDLGKIYVVIRWNCRRLRQNCRTHFSGRFPGFIRSF